MSVLREGSAEEAGFDRRRLGRVAELAERWVAEGHTPSLVVLAARRGVIALHRAYGQQSPDGEALPRDSVFPIMSVSKPLTAATVLALAEDGLLGLHRPVADYLPELTGEGKEEVLVAHLLTHTSGLSDEVLAAHAGEKASAADFDPGSPHDASHPGVHALLAPLWDAPLARSPGSQMEYSDYNYSLLGELASRVTGRCFDEVARERVFTPLGMTDTSYVLPEALLPRLCRRPLDAPMASPDAFVPGFRGIESRFLQRTPLGGSGACSTASDLAVFLQMMLNGGRYGDTRVLSRPAVEAATRNQNPGIGCEFPKGVWHREAGYGYGWIVQGDEKYAWAHGSLPAPGTFLHQGAGGAYVWADPHHDVLGVWLGVTLEMSESLEQHWNADLFQNAVTAAVA